MDAAECLEKIRALDWAGLRALWAGIRAGDTPGWASGKAFEYLVLRAFELDGGEPAAVRYPYSVPLLGMTVEQIDGAVHLPGLSCLVESKDWKTDVDVAPIARMRSQLLRRPAGTAGLLFSRTTFTDPAKLLVQFMLPQAILLWSGDDVDFAMGMEKGRFSEFLRLKHRVCCENGLPNYPLITGTIS